MKLPNGNRADLGAKLEEYSLNPLPPRGQHKARVFESVPGITPANKGTAGRGLAKDVRGVTLDVTARPWAGIHDQQAHTRARELDEASPDALRRRPGID
jgi:hypothetical protein